MTNPAAFTAAAVATAAYAASRQLTFRPVDRHTCSVTSCRLLLQQPPLQCHHPILHHRLNNGKRCQPGSDLLLFQLYRDLRNRVDTAAVQHQACYSGVPTDSCWTRQHNNKQTTAQLLCMRAVWLLPPWLQCSNAVSASTTPVSSDAWRRGPAATQANHHQQTVQLLLLPLVMPSSQQQQMGWVLCLTCSRAELRQACWMPCLVVWLVTADAGHSCCCSCCPMLYPIAVLSPII